jgi:hypothetical protein
LLVLPLWDRLLFGRFTLFFSIPLLFLAALHIKFAIQESWLKSSLVWLALLGTLLMTLGEFMSEKFHQRNKEEIFTDLMTMKRRHDFRPNDLILTKNGAEHICNWFLNVKAGVITSLNKEDFERYGSIFILNPIEGKLNFQGIEGREATNEMDRYLFMMRNIPQPGAAALLYKSEYMELSRVDEPPQEWKYDSEGNWIAYSR